MTVTDSVDPHREAVGDPLLELLNGFIVQLRAAGLTSDATGFVAEAAAVLECEVRQEVDIGAPNALVSSVTPAQFYTVSAWLVENA